MKKKHIVGIGILIVGTFLLLWLNRDKSAIPKHSPQAASEKSEEAKSQEHQTLSNDKDISSSNPQSQAAFVPDLAYAEKALEEQAVRQEKLREQLKAQWNASINFYGKVLDENDQPVEGANVEFSWNNWESLSSEETFRSQLISDAQGLFSLLGKNGKSLCVTASKTGYYSTRDARQQCFEFGDPLVGIFKPDPGNPVVFHIRKKGPGADLITSQYGVTPSLKAEIPREGSAQIDFFNRKVGSAGQMLVNQTKPAYENWKQADGWSFRMEIPAGGFIEQNEEFPFEAPESGYKPVVEFEFQKEQPNWDRDLKKDYYIKFGNPPRYGRLHLETSIRMSGARIGYVINPDGSRYLEPK